MANRSIIFPAGKKAQADAYKAGCDAHYAATFEAEGIFSYVRPDADGQWVTPYYGAPWNFDGAPFVPPGEIEALRFDGVLHDFAVWPEEE